MQPEEGERRVRTEGLWLKCEHCSQIIWRKALQDNLQVCPKCQHHKRIDARTRLTMLFDDGKFEQFDQELVSTDPLEQRVLKRSEAFCRRTQASECRGTRTRAFELVSDKHHSRFIGMISIPLNLGFQDTCFLDNIQRGHLNGQPKNRCSPANRTHSRQHYIKHAPVIRGIVLIRQ
jgi:hypothetical protein